MASAVVGFKSHRTDGHFDFAHAYTYYSRSVLAFANTSASVFSAMRPFFLAPRARQSNVRSWSANAAPATSGLPRIGTTKGYGLTLLVIGQHSIKPLRTLYDEGERTSAGRCPA